MPIIEEEIYKMFEPLDYKLSKEESNGLITFSVYGPLDIFNLGAYENIAECRQYFPEWNVRFYVAEDAPILKMLWKEDVDVFVMSKPKGVLGTFWRLLDITNCRHEYVLIRDTDQRVSDKDRQAVNAWLKSGLMCHRMHEDSTQTSIDLLACGIGFRTNCLPRDIIHDMVDWIMEKRGHEITYFARPSFSNTELPRMMYGTEQLFLTERVWPHVKNSTLTHGPLGVDFPPWDHKLKWGGEWMMRRIVPGTSNKIIAGARSEEAYRVEDN